MKPTQCCGLCRQGKGLCPTPQACLQPDEGSPYYMGPVALVVAAIAGFLIVVWVAV